MFQRIRKKTVTLSRPIKLTQLSLTQELALEIKRSLMSASHKLQRELKRMKTPSFWRSSFERVTSREQPDLQPLANTLSKAAQLFKFDMSATEIDQFNKLCTSFVTNLSSIDEKHREFDGALIATAMVAGTILLVTVLLTAEMIILTAAVSAAIVFPAIIALGALALLVGAAIGHKTAQPECEAFNIASQVSSTINQLTNDVFGNRLFEPKWKKPKDATAKAEPAARSTMLSAAS